MKKILLGTFFSAALIIAGTSNVNAQKKSESKVITREVVTKKKQTEKTDLTKKLNTTPTKVSVKKGAKKVTAKEKIKARPAKIKTKEK